MAERFQPSCAISGRTCPTRTLSRKCYLKYVPRLLVTIFPSPDSYASSVLRQMQEDEPTAFVTYEKFEKKMLSVIESQEYAPDGEDVLLQAFRVSFR